MVERPRVFVTRILPGLSPSADARSGGNPLDTLHGRTACRVWTEPRQPTPEELREAAAGCEGLLCLLTDAVDRALFDACPKLRVVSSCSVGVDHVDLAAATERGIPVGHTPGILVETTADLAFALLLAAARRVVEADRFVRESGAAGPGPPPPAAGSRTCSSVATSTAPPWA
jgi:lactate dehydrogenase-like 2-hydroxyacid dehydrogenase